MNRSGASNNDNSSDSNDDYLNEYESIECNGILRPSASYTSGNIQIGKTASATNTTVRYIRRISDLFVGSLPKKKTSLVDDEIDNNDDGSLYNSDDDVINPVDRTDEAMMTKSCMSEGSSDRATARTKLQNKHGIIGGKSMKKYLRGYLRSAATHIVSKQSIEKKVMKYGNYAKSAYDDWFHPDELGWLQRRNYIIENVRMVDSHDSKVGIIGKFHITLTHLIFQSNDTTREQWILINLISSLDSKNFSSMGKSLVIKCKDFHVFKFTIEDCNNCDKLRMVLTRLLENFDQYGKLPCFISTYDKDLAQWQGWVDPDERFRTAFTRMGLDNQKFDLWKFTDINQDYRISDTYPSLLVVPSSITKTTMEACSKFRSRGRLPVLTYYCKENETGLCRCSQPLVGFSARCNEDIEMLRRIKDALPPSRYDREKTRLHVVDTRPIINAIGNKAKGKGYENKDVYEKIVFQFFDIENIHVMRSSLNKLLAACRALNQPYSTYISAVEKSGWLKHLKLILDTSFYITQKMLVSGENVLVHCSDGWDRTSQVCALSQIILDPYYRTIRGLEELIEKDWLGFGHKFADRCGQLSSIDSNEVSPVFTQFLDCLYQLTRHYLNQFEYNELLLRYINRWARSAEFGTFVGNCQKDRIDLRSNERTQSTWGYVQLNKIHFTNPYYQPDQIIQVLPKQLRVSEFKVWHKLYCPVEDVRSIYSSKFDTAEYISNSRLLHQSINLQNKWLYHQIRNLLNEHAQQFDKNKLSYYQSRFEEISKDMSEPPESNDDGTSIDLSCLFRVSDHMKSVNVDCHLSTRTQSNCHQCQQLITPAVLHKPCFSCGYIICLNCLHNKKLQLPSHYTTSATSSDESLLFPVCIQCANKLSNDKNLVPANLHDPSTVSMDPLADLLNQTQINSSLADIIS